MMMYFQMWSITDPHPQVQFAVLGNSGNISHFWHTALKYDVI